eukprot:1161298-Pelagomonas_calceolata.AAC.6
MLLFVGAESQSLEVSIAGVRPAEGMARNLISWTLLLFGGTESQSSQVGVAGVRSAQHSVSVKKAVSSMMQGVVPQGEKTALSQRGAQWHHIGEKQ